MKTIKSLNLIALTMFAWQASPPNLLAGPPTPLYGDYRIEDDTPNSEPGNLTMDGPVLTIGADAASGGVTLQQADVTISSVIHPQLSLIGNATSSAQWIWGYDDGSSGVELQMFLDESNILNLYDGSGNAKIVLDPVTPRITIDGKAVLVLDSSGYIGVGTGSPQGLMHLSSNSSSANIAGQQNEGGSASYYLKAGGSGSTLIGYGGGDGKLNFGTTSTFGGTITPRMTLNSSGNLGLGVTSPTARLEVSGNLKVTGETGSSAAPSVSVTGDGGVVFTGNFGTGQIPASGAGTRLMWYPKKAALRAGEFDAVDAHIGNYSTALGSSSWASGSDSVAIGTGSASGARSFGVGYSSASGTYSVAMGGNIPTIANASGTGAFSMGGQASGNYSVAFKGTASNAYAFAVGPSTASAQYSAAFGYMQIASGDYSFATGYKSTAASAYSFVVGRNNAVGGNATTWIDADPLFVIGNGTGVVSDPADVKNRNALTVLKSGKVNVFGSSGTTPAIVLDPTTSPPQITVGSQTVLTANSTSGNVGIGSATTPSRMLTVFNSAEGTNSQLRMGYSDVYSWDIGRNNTSGNFDFIERNSGANTTRVTFANGGNVGIGTTAPTEKLDIAGNTAISGSLKVGTYQAQTIEHSAASLASAGWYRLARTAQSGQGTFLFNAAGTNAFQQLEVRVTAGAYGTGNAMTILSNTRYNTGPVRQLRVSTDGDGWVHLDAYLEDVQGTVYVTLLQERRPTISGRVWGLFLSPTFGAAAEATDPIVLDTTQYYAIQQINSEGLNAFLATSTSSTPYALPAYSFGNDSNTGVYSAGADALGISTGGTARVLVNSSGNVGIGTATPTAKLDVSGDAKFSGAVRIVRQGDVLMGEFGNPE